MTAYLEVVLAREREMCFVTIALVTDWDVGMEGIAPVTAQEVVRVFKENNQKVKRMISQMLREIPTGEPCICQTTMKDAEIA